MSYNFGVMSYIIATVKAKQRCLLEMRLLFMNKGTAQACEAEPKAVMRVCSTCKSWNSKQRKVYKRQ